MLKLQNSECYRTYNKCMLNIFYLQIHRNKSNAEINQMYPSRPSTNATFFMNTFLIFDPIGSHLFLLSTSIVVYYSFIYFFPQHIFNKHSLYTRNLPRWLSGKESAAIQEMQALSLGWEDTLEKEMETHSSILAWEIPMDRGSCQVIVHVVTKESDTT